MSEKIPPFTLSGEPANDNALPSRKWKTGWVDEQKSALENAERPLTEIFMRLESEVDGAWGESVRIGLTPDGAADLSEVPEEMREKWVREGIPDGTGLEPIKPVKGQAFIAVLLFLRKIPGARFFSQRY